MSYSAINLYPVGWDKVGTAILCGAIIGFERQLRGRPAGIRTSILICLGTAVFVSLGTSIQGVASDPLRIIGQVVTGVGFLGAGVMMTREGIVMGVTSAAVIWMLAGIGVAIGLGNLATSAVLSVVAVSVLVGVELLEASFLRLRRGVHAHLSDREQGE